MSVRGTGSQGKKCSLENFIYKIFNTKESADIKVLRQSYFQLLDRETKASKAATICHMAKPVKEKGVGCASLVPGPDCSPALLNVSLLLIFYCCSAKEGQVSAWAVPFILHHLLYCLT